MYLILTGNNNIKTLFARDKLKDALSGDLHPALAEEWIH